MKKHLVNIRQYLHAHPELGLAEQDTVAFLKEKLQSLGLSISQPLAQTGFVASLYNGAGKTLGFRADMDALPIMEATNLPYASKYDGCMHACGHDGHMTMLLAAAEELAKTRDFSGTIHFIFQPAEENVGGAKIMVEDGLFQQFPCDMIFALHNLPGVPAGHFISRTEALTSSIDAVSITIHGKGGHGALPHETIDPIVVGAQLVNNLQTIVARNLPPSEAGVVTVGSFHAGTMSTIIPEIALLEVSLRATSGASRALLIQQVEKIAMMTAQTMGATAELAWQQGYPALINHPEAVLLAQNVIEGIEDSSYDKAESPQAFSEDFSFFLEQVPGAMVFIGNGDSAPLHNPAYDFNDEILVKGTAFFTGIARTFLHQ